MPEQDNLSGDEEIRASMGEDDRANGQRSSCERRGTDPVALVAGIASLLVSVYVLSDGAGWLPALDLRWILAGGAMLVGVLMVAASLRGKRG